jgi:hypothetical protein
MTRFRIDPWFHESEVRHVRGHFSGWEEEQDKRLRMVEKFTPVARAVKINVLQDCENSIFVHVRGSSRVTFPKNFLSVGRRCSAV